MASRSTAACSTGVLVGVLLFTAAWHRWRTRNRRRSANAPARFLLTTTCRSRGKVLDLRPESSFSKARIRGSHNIPAASLWDDNRWYELPEQHEPLVVLVPEEGAPARGMSSGGLAAEISSRRAEGATATLVFDRALLETARETGLLLEAGGAEPPPQSSYKREAGSLWSYTPSTLFTPNPFLARAAVVMEAHLNHAGLPLTCIDIGCGAGRDAVWLARRGWAVTAVDCWNQVLQKATQLAHRNGVSDRVKVVEGKVKNTGEIHLSVQAPNGASKSGQPSAGDGADAEEHTIIRPATPASEYGAFALVVAIRFLERNAFETLERLVDPRGGYILLSTFIEEERETAEAAGAAATGETRSGGEDRRGLESFEAAGAQGRNSSGDYEPGSAAAAAPSSGGEGGSARLPPAATATAAAKMKTKAKMMKSKKAQKFGKNKPGSAAAALEAATAAATMARWPHASPRDPKKILRRGELGRFFQERHGFEVLENSVTRLPDGRPVCCFLARRLPLLVSSPSNASNASSVTSPWNDDFQPSHLAQQSPHKPGGLLMKPPGAAPASSFDAGPASAALFLGKSTLAPTPETPALDIDGGSMDSVEENRLKENNDGRSNSSSKSLPPMNVAFPAAHYLDISDADSSDDGEEGEQ